jgi:hypothetical protein
VAKALGEGELDNGAPVTALDDIYQRSAAGNGINYATLEAELQKHVEENEAHREHREILRRERLAEPSQYSRIERYFILPVTFAVRAFAGTLMVMLWFFVVGPVWLAILLRTISAFSIATIVALFTHATPPDVKRLDAVAEVWVLGFRKIFASTFLNEPGPQNRIPVQPEEAVRETIFAILLYSGMYSTFMTIGVIYRFIFG